MSDERLVALLARLDAIRGVYTWEELSQACREVLWHGSEGTERLWGSSIIAACTGVFGELAKYAPSGEPTTTPETP